MIVDFEKAKKAVGSQTDLLRYWDEISETDRVEFTNQLTSLNIASAIECFNESADITKKMDKELFKPIPKDHRAVVKELDETTKNEYWNLGLEAVAKGEVAALVLAGGQASRLGSAEPKGTIPLGLGLDHCNSLLALQAGKIATLQELARKKFPNEQPRTIQWLVMTSKSTAEATKKHLEIVRKRIPITEEQVTLFSQAEIPAFDEAGNLLLSNKNAVVTSPNGNGGVYSALAEHLPMLKERGVKYFHVYCIDNILCKVADPHFIGYAVAKGADVVTKTVPKSPGELVGSVCRYDGRPRITEYTELGEELAEKLENGRLVFGDGSIANHLFTMEFLEKFCTPSFHLPYHRASKKIPHVNKNGDLVKPVESNGIKLEQFIFDVFPMSENFYIWEVEREDEFAPLKNAESIGKDCLSTCQAALAAQSKRWLEAAGATVALKPVYVPSTLSYDGEELEQFKGQVVADEMFL